MVAAVRQHHWVFLYDEYDGEPRWGSYPGQHALRSVPGWSAPAYRFHPGLCDFVGDIVECLRLLAEEPAELPLELRLPAGNHQGSPDRGELRRPAGGPFNPRFVVL